MLSFHSVQNWFCSFAGCIAITRPLCTQPRLAHGYAGLSAFHKLDEQHQDSIREGMFYLRAQLVTYYLISLHNLLTLIVKTFPAISAVPK